MIAFIEAPREVFGVEPICRVLPIGDVFASWLGAPSC